MSEPKATKGPWVVPECQSIRGEWNEICPDCGQRLPAKPGPLSSRRPSPSSRPPSKHAFGVGR